MDHRAPDDVAVSATALSPTARSEELSPAATAMLSDGEELEMRRWTRQRFLAVDVFVTRYLDH